MVDVALTEQDKEVDNVRSRGLKRLRKKMIRAKVDDRPLLINMGMLEPDFRTIYTDEDIFPASDIFDLLDDSR